MESPSNPAEAGASELVTAFLGAYLIGAVLIYLIPASALLLKAIVVSAIVLAYFFFLRVSAHKRGWSHEFGDSVYYLGFGFTLTALIIGVWKTFGAAGEARNAEQLLGQFGAALLSTLIGVGCRICERLIWLSPEEGMNEAIQRIREMTGELVSSLEEVNRRTRSVAQENLDALKEGIAQSDGELRKATKGLNIALGELSQSIRDVRIDPKPLKEAFSALRLSAQSAHSHMSKHVDALGQTVNTFAAHAANIGTSITALDASLRGQMEVAANRAASFTLVSEQTIAHLEDLSKSLASLRASMASLSGHEWSQTGKAISGELESFSKELQVSREITRNLAAAASSAGTLHRILSQEVSTVERDGAGIASAINELSVASSKILALATSMDEIVDATRRKIDHIR